MTDVPVSPDSWRQLVVDWYEKAIYLAGIVAQDRSVLGEEDPEVAALCARSDALLGIEPYGEDDGSETCAYCNARPEVFCDACQRRLCGDHRPPWHDECWALATPDEHPPTFHIREHRLLDKNPAFESDTVIEPTHPAWSWSCVEANGKQIAWSGETYVDRSHAVEMARRFAAGFPGAKILDDGSEL